MISIITPFYQSEEYLKYSIESILNQTYQDWELLLINDGSTDTSKKIALKYGDSRIRYFEQKNMGVSSARNIGLENMRGEYFCFLDADDVLPTNSLELRCRLLENNPFVRFADGQVKKYDHKMEKNIDIWRPDFEGPPLKDLVNLTGKSFLGLTWMVRRNNNQKYLFKDGLTHSEDLLFLMEIAKDGGYYAYTNETILHYRNTPGSAMKNLRGLENGYRYIESEIKNWKEVGKADLRIFRFKYRKAMFLAYLNEMKIGKAIKSWI